MSRFALSDAGCETPIDREGFQAVVRLSDRYHHRTGVPLWYAGDAVRPGVLVLSELWAYVSDSLPVLLRLLKDTGFSQVSVDMASLPASAPVQEGEEVIPLRRRKVDPWRSAVPKG